ncbi:unnamed protein product [Notodromas monacha]|uniref:Sorting nexin-2 n=1 Tax=Notodromas monacha TaxID=399045 RepID=A0A7R9BMM4_9CRUS|nr:unnamed protein product [Notodromas monacha]CAG0917468.1 unnamed protein product [Notodromas monacha]
MMAEHSDPLDASQREDSNEDLFASAMENIDPKDASEATLSSPPLQEEVPLNDDEDEDEDEEDPQMIIPEPAPAPPKTPEAQDDQFLEISVSEPQKVGEGMVSYVVYKVTTRTNLPYFKRRNSTVTRRFSDFLGLHDKLVEKYLHSGRIVPPAPEKNALGTTKVKMSNDMSPQSSTPPTGGSVEFIERRRASLERFINRTAEHLTFRADPDFREFLETDGELPKATSTSVLSGAGFQRLLNRFGETVNKMTFKMDESDPWFEEKSQQVENLDNQLRRLHTSLEALAQYRRDLAASTTNFARSAATLANCEEHTGLSRVLSSLAEVEEKVEQVHIAQSNSDFFYMCELVKDYIGIIGAVKAVLHERIKAYQLWQHAQQMLNKKRETKARLEIAGKTDKVAPAKDEVSEWEAKVERCQESFENVSKMIKKEMDRFDQQRVSDFQVTIAKYLEDLLQQQEQVTKIWEGFLPQAKAIV